MNFKICKNPNPEAFSEISELVKNNDGFCPCLLNKDEDTKCMCKDFRNSDEVDFCHCGRYYKVNEYETIAVIADISNPNYRDEFINWCEMLIHQDFEVLGVTINMTDYHSSTVKYRNLCKSLIAKANAILVLNHTKDAEWLIDEYIYWAEELGKKVLTMEDLKK